MTEEAKNNIYSFIFDMMVIVKKEDDIYARDKNL